MPDYKLKNGQVVTVRDEDIDSFLSSKHGDGAIIVEALEGSKKEIDSVVADQAAESVEVMGSKQKNGSSDLPTEGIDFPEVLDEVVVNASSVPASIYELNPDVNNFFTSDTGRVAEQSRDVMYNIANNSNATIYEGSKSGLNETALGSPDQKFMIFGEDDGAGYKKSMSNLIDLKRSVSFLKNKSRNTTRGISSSELDRMNRLEKELADGYDAHEKKYETFADNVEFRSIKGLADRRFVSSGKNVKRELYNSGSESDVKASILAEGKMYLNDDSKEVVALRKKLETEYIEGSEEYKKAEDRIKDLTGDSDKLLDYKTGKFVLRKNASKKSIANDDKAIALATTDIETLENRFVDTNTQLVGAIKDAGKILRERMFNSGSPEEGELVNSTGFTSIPNDVINNDVDDVTSRLNAEAAWKKYKSMIEEVERTNKLPANISDLTGLFDYDYDVLQDTIDVVSGQVGRGEGYTNRGFSEYNPVLAKKFNKTLDEYFILNKAIQTNTNPLSNKDVNYFEELYDGLLNVGGYDYTTLSEEKGIMHQVLRESGVDEKDLDDQFDSDKNIGQTIFKYVPALGEFGWKLGMIRKGSGNAFGKLSVGLNKLVKKVARGNKYLISGAEVIFPALAEGGEFLTLAALENTFGSGEKQSLGDSFLQGSAFGLGSGLGRPFLKKMGELMRRTGVSKAAAEIPLLRNLDKSKFLKKQKTDATGAAIGASTYILGSALMNPADYDYSHILETGLEETGKMFILTKFKAGIPGFRKSFEDATSDYLSMKNINAGAIKGAEALGISTDKIKKPTEDSNDITRRAAEAKAMEVKALLVDKKITPIQANDAWVNIAEAKKIVDATVGVNQTKEIIEEGQKSGDILTKGQQYTLGKVAGEGRSLTYEQSIQMTNISPQSLLYNAGIEATNVNLNNAKKYIDSQIRIKALLDGNKTYVSSEGFNEIANPSEYKATTPQTKKQTYKFLQNQGKANDRLKTLKDINKKNLSPIQLSELDKQIESAEIKFEEYIDGGAKYKDIQEKLAGAAALEYSKDVNKPNALDGGGRKGKVVEIKDPIEFEKKLEDIDGPSEGGRKAVAFIDPKDGGIYINQKRALEVGDVSPLTHEQGHFLVMDILKDAKGDVTPDGIKFIDEVLESISPKEREEIKLNVASRYDARDSNKEKWYEENLTVLSEFIKEKKIDFSRADKKSVVETLKGLLDPLQKKHFKNLDTSSPKGLFELLRGLAEGKKSAIDAANEFSKKAAKAKGKPTDEKAKVSKSNSVEDLKYKLEDLKEREDEFIEQADYDAQVSNLEFKIKQAEKKSVKSKTPAAKKAVTAKQTASSEKVQELYNNKKEGWEAGIIKEFEPIVGKIVQTRRNVPGYDEVKLTKALNLDKTGLLDLIKKYNTDKNADIRDAKGEIVPVAAYVNTLLRRRSVDIFKKVLDEKFTEDISKADKVAAETSKPLEKDVKLIKATKILSDDQLKRAKKIVVEAKIEDKNLSYKKLKGITSEITSEITGIPAGKINNPKKNLSQGETTTAAMFIEKNIEYIKRTLPEGAVLEGARDDSGLINTSTGVPKNMLNAFYTKAKRGDNLSPFMLKGSLTSGDILKEIGRPRGEKPVKIDPRSDRGSVIKGIIDIVDRNITNELVRTERGLTEDQKLNAGAGRGKAVFSNAPKSPLRTELLKAIDDRLKIPELRKLVDESKANKETKDIFYGIISDLDKSFLGKESDLIAKDLEVLTKQAKELGIELPELIKSSEEAAKNWKQAISSINKLFGTEAKYSSEPDLTKPENIERTLNILKSVVDFYPNIAELGKEAKPLLSAIKATVGTNAGLKINGKAISVDMFNEMAKSLGKGKKIKPWMKKVYQPAWGYGNGFKGQTERALTRLKNTKIGWEKDYALVAANLLTNPKLRKLNSVDNFEGYNQTQEANREAIKSIYYGLAKGLGKNKNKTEAIEDIINFLKLQTNHASGIIKGFVPMTMITTEPGGPKDKKTHNEHMKELFNYNRLFIDILAAHQKDPTSKTALAKIDILVESLQQGLTSEYNKLLKDSKEEGGATGIISENTIANTFPTSREADGMIMLAKMPGASLNEYMYSTYAPTVFRTMVKNRIKASESNNASLPSGIKFSKPVSNERSIELMSKMDKALDHARKLSAPVKKIRVFDFDDTLAKTKSNVLYTMPDGTKGKINPAEFAKKAGEMEADGAKWDFSEFSKVMEGKKGPLFEVAKIIADKRGAEDLFVLTARPQEAAGPIKEFLKSLGLDIPLKNITGLGNGEPQAKANWIIDKAAEGYNDFYFADDHLANVKGVKDALSVLDVKSKVQLAKVKFSKGLDEEFNKIIENKTGIAAEKNYAAVKAALVGKTKGKFEIFIPPSAEDFVGLLYKTLGKGKVGDAQMAWYKKSLLDPYARAMENITRDRTSLGRNFKALKKELKIIPRNLKKRIKGEVFTKEQAVRVYIWEQTGEKVPGLSKADQIELVDMVKAEPELQMFATEIMKLGKGRGYIKPSEHWTAGTITTDLIESLNTTGRKQYLEQWKQNVDVIFSEKNLNKLEAAYGSSFRIALAGEKGVPGILKRMETGRNRTFGGDTLTGRFTDWINASVGNIMFFNGRSAVLQTISAINFIDFRDNNIFAAGKAFANLPQYKKDFTKLFGSDYLVERRDGLKININEADIADLAKENGVRGLIAKALKVGFLPTQIADSFAIASGGATFYRTKINALIKGGMHPDAAEKQAMREFREKAEESQQSSRPDKISAQQAGPLGRIVLAFANTPAQYARLTKKAALDLKNGRGNKKENISRILYYSVASNLLFNAMQQALFAVSFGDDEEELGMYDKRKNAEAKEKKAYAIINGMVDSVARGTGVVGAAFSVVKNAAIKLYKETDKKNPKYEDVALELLKISPPISSKITKVRSAGRSASWDMDDMKSKGFSLDNPAYLAAGNTVSAFTNIPMDRVFKKINNIVAASDEEVETYKRMFLLLGWSEWELGLKGKKDPIEEEVISTVKMPSKSSFGGGKSFGKKKSFSKKKSF